MAVQWLCGNKNKIILNLDVITDLMHISQEYRFVERK